MDDPRNLWQSQEVEEMKISVDELRAKAAKFQQPHSVAKRTGICGSPHHHRMGGDRPVEGY